MHPILVSLPVQLLQPWLNMGIILVAVAAVGFISYRMGLARGQSGGDAMQGAVLPSVVALVVLKLAQGSSSAWPLHTYGVLIACGFILGISLAVREARRTGFSEDAVLDMGFWALVSGMVGARIYFIAVNWKEYFVTRPWTYVDAIKMDIPSVLAVWQGGLVFYGGALGATLTFIWYARSKNLPMGRFGDIIIPSLPLGHALGRMGCFAAGCCWGDSAFHLDAAGNVVQDFPFVAQFPKDSLAYGSLLRSVEPHVHDLMVQTGHTLPLYPTQWMEAVGEICIFGILILVRSRKVFHGQVVFTYFLLYPLLRATLEFFRGDAERGYIIPGVLSVGQFTSILVAIGALITLVVFIQRKRKSQAAAAVPA